MSLTVNNKTQTSIRENLFNTLGLREENKSLKCSNYYRIFGGIGAVFYNGRNAAGQGDCCNSTAANGDGGADDGGGSGGGGSGGGGSGGGGSVVCECVDISDELLGKYNICCLNGFDCETGKPLQLLLDGGDYFRADIDCDDEIENGSNAQVIFGVGGTGVDYACCRNRSSSSYQCLTLSKALSLFGSMKGQVQGTCSGTSTVLRYTNNATETSSGAWRGTLEYTEEHAQISGCSNQSYKRTVQARIYSNGNTCQNIIENPNKSKFFLNNGKFYNLCDPYGQPPQNCITMCDSNGNRFEVCSDGNVTAL